MTLAIWFYTSLRSFPAQAGTEMIQRIVTVSRARNGRQAITGALFFTGTHFTQFIEGPQDDVLAIRDSIAADYRHEDVRTQHFGTSPARRLPSWTLAYCAISEEFDRLIQAVHRSEAGRGAEALLGRMSHFVAGELRIGA